MKHAAVRLEADSFADDRFPHLARLLGFPGGDGDFALIKVSRIWSWQTMNYTPEAPCFVVPLKVIERHLGEGGAAALVRADLAEEHPDGLRMRGSSHERTGWLYRAREKGKRGGEESGRTRRVQPKSDKPRKQRNKNEAVVQPGLTTGEAQVNLAGSAQVNPLSSSLSSQISIQDLGSASSGASDLRSADPVPALWAEQERRRAELPRTRPLPLTPERRRAIARLLAGGFTFQDLLACIGQYADEAASSGDAQWFNGDTNWVARNVTRTLGRIGAGARRRDGPLGNTAAAVLPGLLDEIAALEAAERERQ